MAVVIATVLIQLEIGEVMSDASVVSGSLCISRPKLHQDRNGNVEVSEQTRAGRSPETSNIQDDDSVY
jgi:hypothetical protein